MDQTSAGAAIVVPIAAGLGVVGMLTALALTTRNARDVICPQRARREALEAAGARAAAAPQGGLAVVVEQRTAVRATVSG
jgi:hypothetical protein